MDWSQIYLDTFIPELPKFWNGNFSSFKRYLDVFYDENREIIIKPLETAGRVKGARGEFVTCVVDNLVVRNQFTNLYQNTTTADLDFVTSYLGADVSTRVSTWDPSVAVWPQEPSAYSWVDVNTPYIKIGNDASYGFQNNNIGQEFQIVFDLEMATTDPYTILLQSASTGPVKVLNIDYADASAGTWIKLINIAYDASWGPTWIVKQSGGTYTIS
ncbi:MAG TPA: hypothetical protein PK122_00830 [Candidatus Paceibacterota bacterium]|nr:hypothetical protein [Candidatus Paceibacterota bacterium]